MKADAVRAVQWAAMPPSISYLLGIFLTKIFGDPFFYNSFSIASIIYASIAMGVIWIYNNGFSDRKEVIKREHSNRPQAAKGDTINIGDDVEIAVRSAE